MVKSWVCGSLVKGFKIRFTKHALEKLEFVRRYAFNLDEKHVVDAVKHPVKIEQKGDQYVVSKVLDDTYGLRVVYEIRKDYLVVITFYPVRRERYGI